MSNNNRSGRFPQALATTGSPSGVRTSRAEFEQGGQLRCTEQAPDKPESFSIAADTIRPWAWGRFQP
jgi:hypothetical protein